MNVNMITVDFAIKMYSLANKLKHPLYFLTQGHLVTQQLLYLWAFVCSICDFGY